MKQRLDQELVARKLVSTRSQAESYIKLGQVKVNGHIVNKGGVQVSEEDRLEVTAVEQYVSRAALKLESVAKTLNLDFRDKIVLDVGSSTGGFTDYALRNGASKVIAVELGTNQMDSKLKQDPRIELHEKTDIRDFVQNLKGLSFQIDVVVMDLSFVSLQKILPSIDRIASSETIIVAMVKPQFEASNLDQKHKGVIKNDRMRRDILKDFEIRTQKLFNIQAKMDSSVSGSKGNKERFYVLKRIK